MQPRFCTDTTQVKVTSCPTTYSHVLVVGHAEINIIYPSLPPGACSLGFGFSSHSDMTPASQPLPLGLLCAFLLLCWSCQYCGGLWALFEVALSSLTTLLLLGSLYANNFQICISGFNSFSELKLQISNCQHGISTGTLTGTSNLAWPEINLFLRKHYSLIYSIIKTLNFLSVTTPHTCYQILMTLSASLSSENSGPMVFCPHEEGSCHPCFGFNLLQLLLVFSNSSGVIFIQK